MKYYCYILYSPATGRTYIGISSDVEKRLKEHNAGRSGYSKKYKPWVLISTESYKDRQEARVREKYFKSSTGRKKIAKLYSGIV